MSYAQSSVPLPSIQLSAPDSIIYSVFVDSQSKVEMVKGNQSFVPQKIGDRLIDVILHTEPMVHLRTTLRVDSIQAKKVRIAVDAASYTLIIEGNTNTTIDYTKPTSEVVLDNALEVEVNVGNALRCAPPAAPEMVQSWIADLASLDFERERLKLLQRILASSCFTVQQIEALIANIEDEQRRIDLLQIAFGNCFNQQAYDKLKNMLYLDRNQVAFTEWLQSERASQTIGSGK